MGLSYKYKDNPEIISLGISLFNTIYLNKKNINENKILNKVSISQEESLYKDYYTRIVAHTMSKTSWYKLFRLNFKQTLNLEYSTFIYLKDILD